MAIQVTLKVKKGQLFFHANRLWTVLDGKEWDGSIVVCCGHSTRLILVSRMAEEIMNGSLVFTREPPADDRVHLAN